MGVSRCETYLFATYKKIRCAIYSGQLSAGEKNPICSRNGKEARGYSKGTLFFSLTSVICLHLGFPKMKQKISDQKMPEKPKTKSQGKQVYKGLWKEQVAIYLLFSCYVVIVSREG